MIKFNASTALARLLCPDPTLRAIVQRVDKGKYTTEILYQCKGHCTVAVFNRDVRRLGPIEMFSFTKASSIFDNSHLTNYDYGFFIG